MTTQSISLTPKVIAESASLKGSMFADDGALRLLPLSFYRSFSDHALKLVCIEMALYVVPTVELVEILQGLIGGRSAIEICSGNNCLHRHLGITGTDACNQSQYAALYAIMGQPITSPPSDVVAAEADEAVERYRPDVVIGAFSTQRISERDPVGSGSATGVDHLGILKKVRTLILVGNSGVHEKNFVLSQKHEVIKSDGIITRASDQGKNAIWVFHNETKGIHHGHF